MGRKTGSMLLAAALVAPVWAWPTGAQEPVSPTRTVERAVAAGTDDAAQARAQALAAMERLRGEIQTLAAIRDAQAALLAWNRERAKTGAAPAALSAAPCRDPALKAWCPLLPATFGEDIDGSSRGNGR